MTGGSADRATLRALVPMLVLLGALSYGAEAQGAFYDGPFHVFVALVTLALVVALALARSWAWARTLYRDPLVVMVAALALVTVLSAAIAGAASNAIGTVSLLATMAAVVAVVRSLEPEPRRLLVAAVVALGVVVALVGWVAVVARWSPDALTGQGLWRAASTLTYENALACFLTPPALVCLDRLMTAPVADPRWSGAAFALLVGEGASLSRGGVLGLAVGVAVLALWRGPRTLARLLAPGVGALVALACLAPSVPVASSPHVALACVGFGLGAAVTAWPRAGGRPRVVAVVAGAAVLGVLLATAPVGRVVSEIARARASAASSDRAHEWAAAFDLARSHLLLGVGAAHVLLQWEVGGRVFTAYFAHNEFLQLMVQDGLVGLVVLVAGVLSIFVRLVRLRGRVASCGAPCATACLVALLVQSAFDFLWHIPVIPVLWAVVLAAATTPEEPARGCDSAVAARVRSSRGTDEGGGWRGWLGSA